MSARVPFCRKSLVPNGLKYLYYKASSNATIFGIPSVEAPLRTI